MQNAPNGDDAPPPLGPSAWMEEEPGQIGCRSVHMCAANAELTYRPSVRPKKTYWMLTQYKRERRGRPSQGISPRIIPLLSIIRVLRWPEFTKIRAQTDVFPGGSRSLRRPFRMGGGGNITNARKKC